MVFLAWLIGQTLFVIGALRSCCAVVWAVTFTGFWYVTLRNLHAFQQRIPDAAAAGTVGFLRRSHSALLGTRLVAVAGLVLLSMQATGAKRSLGRAG